MIAGIGTDLCAVERWSVPRPHRRLFDDDEWALCASSPHQQASRFAAKEAVMKALSSAWGQQYPGRAVPQGWRWRDIHVRGGGSTPPWLELTGVCAQVARELGISRWHVSLSHEVGMALAFVVAWADEMPGIPPADEAPCNPSANGAPCNPTAHEAPEN